MLVCGTVRRERVFSGARAGARPSALPPSGSPWTFAHGTAPAVPRSPPPSRAPFSSPIRFRVTWLGLPSAPEPLDFRPTRSVGPRRFSGTPGLFATHINILTNDPCHTILPTVLPHHGAEAPRASVTLRSTTCVPRGPVAGSREHTTVSVGLLSHLYLRQALARLVRSYTLIIGWLLPSLPPSCRRENPPLFT